MPRYEPYIYRNNARYDTPRMHKTIARGEVARYTNHAN